MPPLQSMHAINRLLPQRLTNRTHAHSAQTPVLLFAWNARVRYGSHCGGRPSTRPHHCVLRGNCFGCCLGA
eukprot:11171818-Lingulodinium_polyedra.AAC.1